MRVSWHACQLQGLDPCSWILIWSTVRLPSLSTRILVQPHPDNKGESEITIRRSCGSDLDVPWTLRLISDITGKEGVPRRRSDMALKRPSNAPLQPHRAPIAHTLICSTHGQLSDLSLNPRYSKWNARLPPSGLTDSSFIHGLRTRNSIFSFSSNHSTLPSQSRHLIVVVNESTALNAYSILRLIELTVGGKILMMNMRRPLPLISMEWY